jgi:hypothetical protein
MTTYFRSINNREVTSYFFSGLNIADDGPFMGTAYELQAYIAIRWIWLAFPASLLVLTLLFLVFIVAQSAESGVAVWKSSPLVLLFHGLNTSSVEQVHGVIEIADMEDHARTMEVSLQDGRLTVLAEEQR